MNELVSVVVPIYNSERTIKPCVDSILRQSYKNTEIILIDDGSTDTSGKICDNLTEFLNIKVIHKKNGGASSARNVGIKNAKGKYILFVDSDDICNVNLIKKLVVAINSFDSDISYCGIKSISSNGDEHSYYAKSGRYNVNEYVEKILLEKNISVFCGAPYGKLYKTSILKENDIYFENNISYGEDFNFNMEVLKYVTNIEIIDDILYTYYIGSTSSLTSFNLLRVSNERYWNERLLNYKCYERIFRFYNCYEINKRKINYLLNTYITSSCRRFSRTNASFNQKFKNINTISMNQYCCQRMHFYKESSFLDNIRILLIKYHCVFFSLILEDMLKFLTNFCEFLRKK